MDLGAVYEVSELTAWDFHELYEALGGCARLLTARDAARAAEMGLAPEPSNLTQRVARVRRRLAVELATDVKPGDPAYLDPLIRSVVDEREAPVPATG